MRDHGLIFGRQYRQRSGPGSTPQASAPYRAFLEQFIADRQIGSVLDLGCGDMEIMSRVDLRGAAYLGVDVIGERVMDNRRKHPHLGFELADIRKRPIEDVDLVIVKDVLQHWTNAEIRGWLQVLATSKARCALITNCNFGPSVNRDIRTGAWRALDLTQPPFELGEVVFRWEPQPGRHKDVVLLDR